MVAIKISMREALHKLDPIKRDVENFAEQSAAVIRDDLNGDDLKLVENMLWNRLTAEFGETMKSLIGVSVGRCMLHWRVYLN